MSQPLDHHTDIYSLGVLMFKMVTGRMPFQGAQLDISVQHCTAARPRPSEVAPDAGIPRELDAIIIKAMARKAEDRFASMKALEQALLGVLARRPSRSSSARAAPRRRRRRGISAR